MRALSLQERQAKGQAPATGDLEQADRFVRWWERTYFPGDPALFSRRLRAQGLNRRSVMPFVAASLAGQGGDEGEPSWWDRWPLTDLPPEEPALLTFHVAFRSFVRRGWSQVEAAVEAAQAGCPELVLDRDVLRDRFRTALNDRLTLVAAQTFAMRLQIARLRRRLTGGDPTTRFESWVRNELGDPDALRRLFDEYPVLGRVFVSVAEGTTAAWSELVVRLAADWHLFPQALGAPRRADRLVDVRAGLGDTHCRGRTVMSVDFESGWSVVYKPRPMRVDGHYQDLVAWLGDRGFAPRLRTVGVLDRGDHGWMEHVSPAACESPEQVEAFYRRQGAVLLLLHLLDATDIHSENLIAAGEHPVPVDLETLFQAPPPTPPGDQEVGSIRTRVFQELVLRTLMLPMPLPGTVGALDIGGLSDVEGKKSPFKVAHWADPNTDRMRLVHRQMDLDGDQNMPRFEGRNVPATEHVEAVVAGFTDAYRLVAEHRDELLAEGGPLAAFRDDHIRYLVRPTVEYGLLLDGSWHPSCLTDALQRDLVFDGLWRSTKPKPYRERAIASEREDLWNEDIPYFSTTVASRDLVDSRGRVIPDFLPASGYERAVDRLARFGGDDLERQVVCIRGSLTIGSPSTSRRRSEVVPDEEASPAGLVEAAVRVGERLATLAIWEDGEAHWTGAVQSQNVRVWNPVGPYLYEGTAGIALFLAHLARRTERRDFEELARAAYRDTSNYLRAAHLDPSIGAFSGMSGAFYTALHLSLLWDEPAVAKEALVALDHAARRLRQDEAMDLVDGAAGCLLVMLRLARHYPDSPAMALATACGRRLLRQAARDGGALSWTPDWAPKPLLGLSHGTAGIAWALAELASATGDRRFRGAARGALAFEERHFDRAAGNWPDFRQRERLAASEDEAPSVAWCHGAPGGGLARLMLRGHGLDDAALDADIATAVSTTAQLGLGDSHCLCHGDVGNAEFLLMAGEALGVGEWRSAGRRRAQGVLVDERRRGWRCGNPGGAETPGLMTGLAGIGYGFLRLEDPRSVPSVLVLDCPQP